MEAGRGRAGGPAPRARARPRPRSCPRSPRSPTDHRVIALDLPGFGDSDKPLARRLRRAASSPAPWWRCSTRSSSTARTWSGNSMGGRVALEVGLRTPERVGRLVAARAVAGVAAQAPAGRRRCGSCRPELGLVQPAPRRIVEGDRAPRSSRARRRAGPRRESTSSCAPTSPPRAAPPSTPRRATSTSRSPTARTASGRACATLEPPALFVWGRARQARADRASPATWREALPRRRAPRAAVRPRPPARAPGRDPRGDAVLPGGPAQTAATSVTCVSRRWLPDGSRKAASTP